VSAWISASFLRKLKGRNYIALHCDERCQMFVAAKRRSGVIEVPQGLWTHFSPCQVCRVQLGHPRWAWYPVRSRSAAFDEWLRGLEAGRVSG